MSTAANHRKRSHRSEAMHYHATARRRVKNMAEQRRRLGLKVMLLDRSIGRIRRAIAAIRKKEDSADDTGTD